MTSYIKRTISSFMSFMDLQNESTTIICPTDYNRIHQDLMKDAFYGRTCGKTSLMKTILHNGITPLGIGQTTNCFSMMEKELPSNDPHVLLESTTGQIANPNTAAIENENISDIVLFDTAENIKGLINNNDRNIRDIPVKAPTSTEQSSLMNAILRNGITSLRIGQNDYFSKVEEGLPSDQPHLLLEGTIGQISNEFSKETENITSNMSNPTCAIDLVSTSNEPSSQITAISPHNILPSTIAHTANCFLQMLEKTVGQMANELSIEKENIISNVSTIDTQNTSTNRTVAINPRIIQETTNNSPLNNFGAAKQQINDIFVDIEQCINDSVEYVHEIDKVCSALNSDKMRKIEGFINEIQDMHDVLNRDRVKVAVLGGTSSEQNSLINAMLGDKILPSKERLVINCFLQVEGTSSNEPYFIVDGTNQHCAIESDDQLEQALYNRKLNESQLVSLFWPNNRCSLLRDYVVFLELPDFDLCTNLNEWIDKHCLDVDIFVIITNVTGELCLADKIFFHKILRKLPKPNIFMLSNNRWFDELSDESGRQIHRKRTTDFLVDELKVCTPNDVGERLFSISIKEVSQGRLDEHLEQTTAMPAVKGFLNRHFEFRDFKKKFEDCISETVTKKEFHQYLEHGKTIANDLREILDDNFMTVQRFGFEKSNQKMEVVDRINYTKEQLVNIKPYLDEKISRMIEDVQQCASKATSNVMLPKCELTIDQSDISGSIHILLSLINDWSFRSRLALISGVLMATGLFVKKVGLIRAVITGGALCGSLYLYKSLLWKQETKAKLFKKQYENHLSNNLHLIVDLISSYCNNEVEHISNDIVVKLCQMVDDMNEQELNDLEYDTAVLDNATEWAENLKNKANDAVQKLELFPMQ